MKRQPKGTRTGGQFSSRSRDEPTLELNRSGLQAKRTSTTILNSRFAATAAIHLAREAIASGEESVWSEDDIAQDALLSLLVSVRNDTIPGLTTGLIAVAVRNSIVAARGKQTGTRHEDLAGRRKFAIERGIAEEALGRHLASSELDQLATKVRNTWPSSTHRPRLGFQLPLPQTVSLSRAAVSSEAANIISPDPEGEEYQRPDFLLDRVQDGDISRTAARRLAWNALAAEWEVPEASHGSVSMTASRRARRFVTSHPGGVSEIARRFLIDGIITPAANALFAPFAECTGSAGPLARKSICDALASHRSSADRMWLSASLYAENNTSDLMLT